MLCERLKNFQNCTKLRKTILCFLAAKSSDQDLKDEIELFNQIDTNKDGYITLKEMKKALSKIPSIDPDKIEEIVKNLDMENNGAINYNEFLAAVLGESIAKDYNKVTQAFKFFDKDNNGYIEDKELKEALTGAEFKHLDTGIFTEIIDECDSKEKGVINMKEFMRVMSVKFEDSLQSSLFLSTAE
eukprot:CAMPEP_0196996614 /NCGR_PEP_ID=MMETSP1380-20130617/2449_1 /TAXON_ID=5936 /ORGANISM="Euplotes crassus, Strain CT5" /LENGTH=185 /DNA_ID=CAMNT_0042412641 /DNA_START=668 /DNA_END=1225 /DNA_ORIENTATION=+